MNTTWHERHGRDLRRTRGCKRCQTASGLPGAIGVGMVFGAGRGDNIRAARGVVGVVDKVNTINLYVSWGSNDDCERQPCCMRNAETI